jgi:ABC-type nitrate/sulfonate/bicarbonate transport system substrate-binding protein
MKKSIAAFIVGVVAVGLSACGSSDSSSSSSTPATSSGAAAAAPSTDGIKVAYASALDPNDVADQFGLEDAGAKVQTLNDDSAVIAGLMRNSIEVGNVDFDQAAAAKAKGLPIKIIYVAQTTPEYVLVGRPDVASLADLAGKKLGYQGPGSQTEIFVKNLVKQKVPDIESKVKFVSLAESSRRAQAMVAKQLDASSLESINYAQLQKQGDYHLLGSWSDLAGGAGEAIGTAWITTDEDYAKNGPRLTAFVKSMQKGYNEAYKDKAAWVAMAKKTLPDVDAALLPAVYDVYVSRSMYPKSGAPAITPESWDANEKFWRSLDEWDKPLSSSVIAFDLVNAGATETATSAAG